MVPLLSMVVCDMLVEIALFTESFPTFATYKRLHSEMNRILVLLQSSILCERTSEQSPFLLVKNIANCRGNNKI